MTSVQSKPTLAQARPDLAAQWHPTKNGDVAPDIVAPRSSVKRWWQCELGHEWQATPYSRHSASCPVCTNRRLLVGYNDAATKAPHLIDEWHPTKNGDRKLSDYLAGSQAKVWWRCAKCGREWQAEIAKRIKGSRCRICVHARRRFTISLAQSRPDLAAQWHPTKNGDLTPDNTPAQSNTPRWWQCELGHEWRVAPVNRYSRPGATCPICNGKRLLVGYNDAATKAPHLIDEWHPTRNGDKQLSDYLAGSHTLVWWLCPACGYEWRSPIERRIAQGTGCPPCAYREAGRRRRALNNLADKYPDIAAQWHPTKNGDLTPADVSPKHPTFVWWLCPKGHAWKSTPLYRTRDHGECKQCRALGGSMPSRLAQYGSLADKRPDIAAQWHPTKNGDLTPHDVTVNHRQFKVWWRADCGHEWQAIVNGRDKRGCPVCSGYLILAGINDLATIKPDIAAQWHPTKNGDLLPTQVSTGTPRKVWWQCERGHEWQAAVQGRDRRGCPYCGNVRVLAGFNDLASQGADIMHEWHPTKNGDLDPTAILYTTMRHAWWQCATCGHEWRATVYQRMCGTICPACAAAKCTPGVDDLATEYPTLAAQWHPTKNGDRRPDQFKSGSQFKAWWRCPAGHEWQTRISLRQGGSRCPACIGHARSQAEVALESGLERRGHVMASDRRLDVAWGAKHRRVSRCDIVLPDERTVIEYDGEYWHRNKQAIDRKKTRALLDAGWRVVRIREQPLDGLNIEHEHYREISWKHDLAQIDELTDLVEAVLAS